MADLLGMMEYPDISGLFCSLTEILERFRTRVQGSQRKYRPIKSGNSNSV